MGTANTMQMLGEVLNLVMPGTSTIPASDNARLRAARTAGKYMVQLAKSGRTPKDLITKEVLETLPLGECDDDFIFDNEMIALLFYNNFKIGEVSCPTKYFKEASSINFVRSCKYGLGVLAVSLKYRLAKMGLKSKIFKPDAKKLDLSTEIEYYFK